MDKFIVNELLEYFKYCKVIRELDYYELQDVFSAKVDALGFPE